MQIYPFIGLADGFSRWKLANEIIKEGRIKSDTLLSPIIPYFQALTYKMVNSYALYTYIQAFVFYFAIGLLVKLVIKDMTVGIKRKIYLWNIITFFVVLFPTVYVFPLMLTDSSPVFVLLICLYVVMNKNIIPNLNLIVREVLLFMITSICIGIRINSIILFFIILCALIIKSIAHRKIMKRNFIAVTLGIIVGVVTPSVLLPNSYNASTLGMIWELTTMASETHDENLVNELRRFGNVEEALNRCGEPYLNSIVWDNNPPFPAYIISSEYSKEITTLYINQFFHNTNTFIKIKIGFVLSTLGINKPLISSRRGIHGVDDITQTYGAIQTERQIIIRELFVNFTDSISFISLRPIIAFLFAILLTILTGTEDVKRIKNTFHLIWIAAIYYISFLINTQAFEFRYFAPSFYILLIIIICDIFLILFNVIKNKK